MTSPVDLTLERDIHRTVVGARIVVGASDPTLGPGPALQQSLTVTPIGQHGNGRVIALAADGRYLCADLHHAVTATRDAVNEWEQFFVIEPQEVDDLLFLLANRWVLHRTGTVIETTAIAVDSAFRLRFGPLTLALAEILPLRHTSRFAAPDQAAFHQADLFADGWKVERISLYRPLVFYVVFGGEALYQQLALSLLSLTEFGGYRDQVLVYADRDAAALAPYVPPALLGKLQVVALPASETLHHKLARYQITDTRAAATCQPLLYVDADVVFDAPLQPTLSALARTDTLQAAPEGGLIADTRSLGADLLRADGIAAGAWRGFQSGTLGCANLTTAGDQLRLIADALGRYARQQADGAVLRDQPVANYVAIKTGGVQTGLLSGIVRFDHASLHGPQGLRPQDRRGMVHFCAGTKPEARREAMAAYLRALRAMLAADPPDRAPVASPPAATADDDHAVVRLDATAHGVLPAWPDTLDPDTLDADAPYADAHDLDPSGADAPDPAAAECDRSDPAARR